jgi:hypothetical protein
MAYTRRFRSSGCWWVDDCPGCGHGARPQQHASRGAVCPLAWHVELLCEVPWQGPCGSPAARWLAFGRRLSSPTLPWPWPARSQVGHCLFCATLAKDLKSSFLLHYWVRRCPASQLQDAQICVAADVQPATVVTRRALRRLLLSLGQRAGAPPSAPPSATLSKQAPL